MFEGTRAYGRQHIEEKHAAKIRKLHPHLTLDDYLRDVLSRYQQIYRQADGSLWLIRDNGCTKSAVVREAVHKGIIYYKVITAYPLPRKPDFAARGAVRLHYTE